MASSAQALLVDLAELAVSESTGTATESLDIDRKTVYLPVVISAPQSVIMSIVFDPPSPATLHHREAVYITFQYSTAYPGTCCTKVTVCYEDGDGCSSMPSGPHYGPSSGTQTIGFGSCSLPNPRTIDTVKLRLITEDQSTVLVEVIAPLEFNFTP